MGKYGIEGKGLIGTVRWDIETLDICFFSEVVANSVTSALHFFRRWMRGCNVTSW